MAKILEKNDPQYRLGFWQELILVNRNQETIKLDIAIAEFETWELEVSEIIGNFKGIISAKLYEVKNFDRGQQKVFLAEYI